MTITSREGLSSKCHIAAFETRTNPANRATVAAYPSVLTIATLLYLETRYMLDTRSKLSHLSVAFHWIVGLGMIAMIAFGLLLNSIPKEGRGFWVGLHKEFGVLLLALATVRLVWRLRNGFPLAAAVYKAWERSLAGVTHWLLLLATLLMPVSELVMSIGGGRPTNVFGLFTIPALAEKNKLLNGIGHEVHEILGYVLILAVGLHVAGALKHHIMDGDGTLRRMVGARIAPATEA